MLPFFRRHCAGTAKQYLSHMCHTTTQRRTYTVSSLLLRFTTTKRNGPEKQKRREPKHRIPSFLDDTVRSQSAQCDTVNEAKQARLWAKAKQAEARLPPSSVAQRSRALDRIYADLVANSAVGSFVSSERGRKLTEVVTIRDMLVWMEEQRRSGKTIFFAKSRAAGLRVFALLQDVEVLVRLGRVICIITWLPMFVLGRIMTLPLPLVRVMAKRKED